MLNIEGEIVQDYSITYNCRTQTKTLSRMLPQEHRGLSPINIYNSPLMGSADTIWFTATYSHRGTIFGYRIEMNLHELAQRRC